MPKYEMFVFTNARDGRDDEFNTWYDEVHVPDIVALPSITSAERYEWKASPRPPKTQFKYLAVYQIDAADPMDAVRDIQAATAKGMVVSDALDPEIFTGIYQKRGT